MRLFTFFRRTVGHEENFQVDDFRFYSGRCFNAVDALRLFSPLGTSGNAGKQPLRLAANLRVSSSKAPVAVNVPPGTVIANVIGNIINGDHITRPDWALTLDIETMVRLLKSAKQQGGLLSGAELSMIMNRSLTSIRKYLDAYTKKTKEILPLKGYVLDQGSLPTHKGIIISLYEQGKSPADIVLHTAHSQEAVDRYIKQYDQIKKLIKKGMDEVAIKEITGRSMKVVREYIKLYYDLNPVIKLNK